MIKQKDITKGISVEIENESNFLKEVEKAAARGARSGNRKSKIILILFTVLLVAGIVIGGSYYIEHMMQSQFSAFETESKANEHDMVLDNNGIFGYTAVDFEDAIIENSKQEQKLIVYSAKISDVTEITNSGFANNKNFSKHQMIKYKGRVEYYIDLSKVNKNDIRIDEKSRIITVIIPKVIQDDVLIRREDIEFSKVTRGALAFGDLKITPEELNEVEKEAVNKMKEKLKEEKYLEIAEENSKAVALATYQKIINREAQNYVIQIESR